MPVKIRSVMNDYARKANPARFGGAGKAKRKRMTLSPTQKKFMQATGQMPVLQKKKQMVSRTGAPGALR